ncbi:MAG: ribonuclease PH [Planctomycetes bacterium]|nr:ribonuclease PH [Planctomycetota bacterium]
MPPSRADGRAPDQLRPVKLQRRYSKYSAGSVLFEAGDTRVVCNVSVEESVPAHLRDTGKGWITAEYGMLPGSTAQRKTRERFGKVDGRSLEIQRLIGRSLRSIVDMELLGERTLWVDCDVLQADGGTRTAAVTGAYVALVDCCNALVKERRVIRSPIRTALAAVSVGLVRGIPILDLSYLEDSLADVDMNVVMTAQGEFIELQGTGEGRTFSRDQLAQLLTLAEHGVRGLLDAQKAALASS